MATETGGVRTGGAVPEDAEGGAVAHVVGLGVDPRGEQPAPETGRILYPRPDVEKGRSAGRILFLEFDAGNARELLPQDPRVPGLVGNVIRETAKLSQTNGRLEGG